MRYLSAVLLLLVAITHSLGRAVAQDTTYVAAGTRVRITQPSAPGPKIRLTGTLQFLSRDSLVVVETRTSQPLQIRTSIPVEIEVGELRSARGQSAAIGALIGGGIGLVGMLGLRAIANCEDSCASKAYVAVLGFSWGAAPGALTGMLVGGKKKERWRKLSPPWTTERS